MTVSRHRPVLLGEVVRLLEPGPGRMLLDLTLGGGGFAAAFLEKGAQVIGLDRDPTAVERTQKALASYGPSFRAVHAEFARLGEVLDSLDEPAVHGICLDLGLSSDQLDAAERGFAFRLDGPLDLRFDTTRGPTAAELLADVDAEELARWLGQLGEVRRPLRLARALHQRAQRGRLLTTQDVREVVSELLPAGKRPEPELARVFQALRIRVNDELGQLEQALCTVPERLRPGGRFVAISYHSLEDRRVKEMLRRESGRQPRGSRHLPGTEPAQARMRTLTQRPLRPSRREVEANPRARSARLRAGERLP